MALSDGQKRYLAKAASTYHEQLTALSRDNDPSGVIAYLTEHGLGYRQAEKYQLGYVGEPLHGDEQFTGRLAIPYLSRAGVQSIKFRAGTNGGPKYLYHSGTKHRIYNADAYFVASEVIGLAEGELDALAASECLGIPSLGVPGVEGFNDLWLPLFKDYNRVLIFADGDEPGERFAATMAEKIGWRARIVQCPQSEDVSSMCGSGRTDELTQLVTED